MVFGQILSKALFGILLWHLQSLLHHLKSSISSLRHLTNCQRPLATSEKPSAFLQLLKKPYIFF
jgi:hypothetical protein